MDDPFDSPPRPGQGGRRMPPRGRGMDRDSPDPFGTPRRPPPRMNPFVSQAAHAGWRPSPMEGHGGNRGTIFGSGGGLFGQFGERRPAPIDDDPFGGSTVAGPREQADRQARLQRAKELFGDTSRFTVEKSNVTTSGLLLRVVEALDDQRSRRFVVKASFPEIGGAIATERDWTYRLRFARHIVNFLTLAPDPMASGSKNIGFQLPYFFMEYLENGTLGQFQDRIKGVRTLLLPSGLEIPFLLPNRMLWSIFLCLIRACVAIAWPPSGPDVAFEEPTLETPSTLAHMDMHNHNVMFGGLDQHEKEHRVVPIAKLIDLGEANERPIGESRFPPDLAGIARYDDVLLLERYRPNIGRRNKGIDKNLLDIGVLMANLISNTRGFVISCQRSIMNPNIHRHLDQDLRLLVQRCLAVNPENRPRLEELIELVGRENSPFFRDENYYRRDIRQGAINPEEMLETDVALYTIVQKYLLDVDTPPSAVI